MAFAPSKNVLHSGGRRAASAREREREILLETLSSPRAATRAVDKAN